MKPVYTTQEGVKMNSKLDFGDTKAILNEFEYLMDTLETIWDAEIRYFYRITDDNYFQLAYSYLNANLKIIAQYKIRFKNLKENIIFVVKNNIEAHLPYHGFPTFQNSSIFNKQEFENLIEVIRNEKKDISQIAIENISPIITFLKEKNLNPEPTGNMPNSW